MEIKKNFKKLLLFAVSAVVVLPFFGQQTVEKYIVATNYLQYLPDGYAQDTTKRWPALIFLHGVGETGNDIEKVRGFGLSPLIEAGKKFPFIVISPQSKTSYWKSEEVRDLLVNDLFVKLRIDPDRVYLTGLSMGGFGTWNTAVSYPEFFAAIIPICGGSHHSSVLRLRNMPIWCFHGDMDESVPFERSEVLVNALKDINPQLKFTAYRGVGHECWTRTYANDSIYDWLLQHKRYKNERVELDNEILGSYQGVYRLNEEQKIDLRCEVEDKGLRMWLGDQKGRLWLPKSVNEFYYDEYLPEYIRFEKDDGGNITGITRISYEEDFYRKILSE
jgi:predicted esterase